MLAIVLVGAGGMFWYVGNSATGDYDEMMQRAHTFIAYGATGTGGARWLDEANELLLLATRDQPDSAEAHLTLAMGYQAKGDSQKALHHYEIAAGLAPALPVHALIGDLYMARGQLTAAQEAYGTALSVDRDSALALKGLATVAEMQGDVDSAVTHWEHLATVLHPVGWPYVELAWLQWRNGQAESAVDVLSAIEPAERVGTDYFTVLGLAHYALEQHEDACRELRVALRLGGQHPELMEALDALDCAASPATN